MSLRIPGFILAAALLVGYRLIKPRIQPALRPRPSVGISPPCFWRALSPYSQSSRSSAGLQPKSAYLPM